MNRVRLFMVLFLLGSASFCQGIDTSAATPSSQAPDLALYQLKAINFDGERSFSVERLRESFHVPVGTRFDHAAVDQGLERLRVLYGNHGNINFTAVPTFQIDRESKTVVLMLKIDEGARFAFGQLFFEGQETRIGEANALRHAWTNMSGKVFSISLLNQWLAQNVPFLDSRDKPLSHQVKLHQSSDTHLADIGIKFPDPKS
jgi:hypothetical protein